MLLVWTTKCLQNPTLWCNAHADLGQYKVKNRYRVIQCFDCHSFGRMSDSNHCKFKKYNADPTLFYCAGTHKSEDRDL